MLKRFLQMFQRKQKEQQKLPLEGLENLMRQLSWDAAKTQEQLKVLAKKDTSAQDNAHNQQVTKRIQSARSALDAHLATLERGTEKEAKLREELKRAQNEPTSPNAQLNHILIKRLNEQAKEVKKEFLDKLKPFAKSYGYDADLEERADARIAEKLNQSTKKVQRINIVYEVLKELAAEIHAKGVENLSAKGDSRSNSPTNTVSSDTTIGNQSKSSSEDGDHHHQGPMSHT